MKDHLKASIARYPKNLENALIHPVSNVDAEIFVEIGQILKKAKLDSVKKIWDDYKYLKDSAILDSLLQWNIDTPETPESITPTETGQKQGNTKTVSLFVRNFISFKGFRIDVHLIRSYESRDEYNFVKNMMEYFIIINRIPETTSVNNSESNKTIRYSDEKLRDDDFAKLDEHMRSIEGIHFINEG